jgi:5-methyltetrahydropteroyltriglutamate--homocysteine methyltransferase
MHEEYKAITDAGFTLQIDGPDLADSWQVNSDMTVSEYRKVAEIQTAALNHALRDSPPTQVRFHMCWGSWHGPHTQDISLADIADIMLTIRANDFSVEAANPCHELDWQVWEKLRLPEGKRLIPGVVGHAVDHVEPPELVAHRILRYAEVVGTENVVAGTDCGMSRVHHEVCWAKLSALSEGAALASKALS